jgi:hypothetical protein
MLFRRNFLRPLLVATPTLLLLAATPVFAQSQALSLPADSPRWELEGQAKVADYQGRKSIFLDGGGRP